ncbi:MAG: winged helix-turn-helix transcriptional regulator [Nocardioidaceae bacterium]|nr:winged helix-turn-helix transcriptional regulator [Nocardioidaceae bacterium]
MDESQQPPALATGSLALDPLGLGVAAERVLRWLLQTQAGSRAAISRHLQMHPTRVSRAVGELEQRGLVWSAPDRGAPVQLAPAGPALRAYARGLQAEMEAQVHEVERLAESLNGYGEAPNLGTHWIEPDQRTDQQYRQRHSMHLPKRDLRAIVPPTVWWLGPLIMLRPPPAGPPLRVLLSHGGAHETCRLPPHTQVRRCAGALPALLVVDETRAAVQVVRRGAHAWGWTTDRAQVDLLSDAFGAYWCAAG